MDDFKDYAPGVTTKAAPNFRIVYPRSFWGKKHSSFAGKVYATWPGRPEEELPNVKMIRATSGSDSAFEVEVTFIGSCEIEYRDE